MEQDVAGAGVGQQHPLNQTSAAFVGRVGAGMTSQKSACCGGVGRVFIPHTNFLLEVFGSLVTVVFFNRG